MNISSQYQNRIKIQRCTYRLPTNMKINKQKNQNSIRDKTDI